MKKIFILLVLLSGCITPKYRLNQSLKVIEPSGPVWVRPYLEGTVSLEECW